MYSVSDWSLCSGPSWISARACDLISGQASTEPFGSPVFARAGKTGPIVVSSSRRTRRVKLVITSSTASRVCAVPSRHAHRGNDRALPPWSPINTRNCGAETCLVPLSLVCRRIGAVFRARSKLGIQRRAVIGWSARSRFPAIVLNPPSRKAHRPL